MGDAGGVVEYRDRRARRVFAAASHAAAPAWLPVEVAWITYEAGDGEPLLRELYITNFAVHFRRNHGAVLLLTEILIGAAATGPVLADMVTPTRIEIDRRAELTNADESITVEAGARFPRLVELRPRRGDAWFNRSPDVLPDHVEVDGVGRAVNWRLDRAASRLGPQSIRLVYRADSPRLKLVWRWSARARHGPMEHDFSIENLGGATIWLPLLPSIRFDWRVDAGTALRRFWVEKGADTPSADGTHDDALLDGDVWNGTSSTYARPLPGKPREMIPYVFVRARHADSDGRGWYLGIEFSGRTHIALQRSADSLRGEAGLDPEPGPYRTRLLPRQRFATPTIFLGAAAGGPDGAGNALRRWVRAVLGNPSTLRNPAYPLLVSNSWGSGMAVDDALARRMISDASSLGLDMFHLDAGWFRGVGDWRADPAKFPHGLATLSSFAHRLGLKFGLWVDWTQAGVSTGAGALRVDDPARRDWLIADPPTGWKHTEEFKGITIDLGLPAASRWSAAEIERIVTENRVDMLEHDGYLVAQGSSRTDHPAAPPEPGTLRIYEDSGYVWVDGSNSTDVSYHATRAYYAIYEQLRRRHPGLLLELCNDGGRMVDFGSAAHGDYFSITDTYDPLSNRRAFFDASYVLPPAMLETYVEKWPAPRIENLRYMLRSGMLGWFSLMLDARRWRPDERAAARAEFALYRTALRPLIREADLYHVSERPDGVHWDGMEYYSARRRRGVLYAFRGAANDQPTHRFRLRGLDPRRRYRLRFHDLGAAGNLLVPGKTLMETGLELTLPEPLSSELVFIAPEP